MKVALIGYGKMGKTIERLLLQGGDEVVSIISRDNREDIYQLNPGEVDVAIEFSSPDSAVSNLLALFERKIPVVCGTTAWLDHLEEVTEACQTSKGALFYSPNFSIGVNIFFLINQSLAKIMNQFPSYEVTIEEIHHTEKLDAPSGTAIATAEQILDHIDRKNHWTLDSAENESIAISAVREADVKGKHTVTYQNKIDEISLTHLAYSRDGFALGAIAAARWIIGKTGIYTMNDMLRSTLQT